MAIFIQKTYFVSPDCPSEILSIIDWQPSELLPLLDHARHTYLLDYGGPPVIDLGPPEYPKNLSELSLTEQKKAKDLYLKMSLSAL